MGLDENQLDYFAFSSFFEKKEYTFPPFEEDISNNTEICYVFGISDKIEKILEWLKTKQAKKLVFLEDRISLITHLNQSSFHDLMNHTKIEVEFLFDGIDLHEKILGLTQKNPYQKIQIFCLHNDKDKFSNVHKALVKCSLLTNAAKSDVMLGNLIVENVIANFRKVHESFDVSKLKGCFKGKTAILVGAGPSLNECLEDLKKLNDQVLIFAAGSGITSLQSFGIKPHMQFAICPTEDEITRLKFMESYEVPLIFGSRLNHNVLFGHAGPLGYLSSKTGGQLETWLEEKLEIPNDEILKNLPIESQTIVSIALESLIYFGVSTVILVGVDLSFEDDCRYANGVVSKLDCSVEDLYSSIGDAQVIVGDKKSLVRWVIERDVLDKIADFHKDVKIYKAVDKGLPFKNIEVHPNWSQSVELSKNLRDDVYEKVLAFPLKVTREKVEDLVYQYLSSMKRVKKITQDLICNLESPNFDELIKEQKCVLAEFDLGDEIAYNLSLKPVMYIIQNEVKADKNFIDHDSKPSKFALEIFKKFNAIVDQYLLLC
jgi:hypothetical protein